MPRLETSRPSLKGYSSGWLTETYSKSDSTSGKDRPPVNSTAQVAASRAHSSPGTSPSNWRRVGTL
jgi:hypothetical protein